MISDSKRPKFLTSVDIGLISIMLIISAAIWNAGRIGTESRRPAYYKISVLNHPERTLFLADIPEKPLYITGLIGTSTIEWNSEGYVKITDSPCPHKICVGMGWITCPESLCCVPNGIVVECLENDETLDGITR